jgi:perosamine synthetase
MFDGFIEFVREIYGTNDFIPLHEPRFSGNEKKYLMDTIDSTFVSSVGKYVDDFELAVAKYTGANYAIATVNGTAALHVALIVAGVQSGDEVVTQSLTFVASCNAISYCDAEPVFVDVSKETLGLSPDSLASFLDEFCEVRNDGFCWNKKTNKIIRACVPMHTFGFPVELDEINQLCRKYNITLVEDAAESLGSTYKEQHTGTIGTLSAVSFNGNKIITTGGGGMLLTNDKALAKKAKHITTTAKVMHKWAFEHDEVGFNYRLPNLNAALGLAQMESLKKILKAKRNVAERYQKWGNDSELQFFRESINTVSNYWLNTVITSDLNERDAMLEYTNKNGVMTRPIWRPMHELPMNLQYQRMDLINTKWLFERLVNVPSSMPVINV